ncbi:hypothetical protein SAMN02745911_3832 [Aureimonas altamirensis DSM 21988]|nr:hypothetical protein SAMN02745911_3832 [Aureimonas altamirensis DSM 21988]
MEVVDKLGVLAERLRERHPEAERMVLEAADIILRDIEQACRQLGIEFDAVPTPRSALSLVHSDSSEPDAS